jgi:hypothetical protein
MSKHERLERAREIGSGRGAPGVLVLALAGLAALTSLYACELTHTSSNSNTSWLRQCDEQAQCGSGLECLCGRCTQLCEADGQCGGDLPGASCEPTSRQPQADSCTGSAERNGKTCALGCRRDDDCAELSAGLVCRGGFCSAQTDAGSTPPDPIGGDGGPVTDGSAGEDAGVTTNDCADGMIVSSAADCLQDDAFCVELPDGRFCTGPATPVCPPPAVPIAGDASCPTGSTCWQYSESLRCRSPEVIDFTQCTDRGGRPVLDPGDGSLFRDGCPNARTALGMFDGPGEGGLCCQLTIDDCKPHDVMYESLVCDTLRVFHWTGLSCAPHMGCCTGPDCDKQTSESDCMQQYAGCSAITKPCGGRTVGTCAADEYCAYLQECGVVDGSAICVPRPTSCEASDQPVCGCDGNSYESLCEAAAAGSGIARRGGC